MRPPNKRDAMDAGMAVFAMIAFFFVIAAFTHKARAHDWYTDKISRHPDYNGWSCCNVVESQPDCKPVRAWSTDDGQWHFIYPDDGQTYDVPDYAMHEDRENPEPFQASACVYKGKVLCFWRKGAGG